MESIDKIPLLGMTLPQLKEVVKECGLPAFNAGQIARWLYTARVHEIDEMTDLSKKGRATLSGKYCVGRELPLAKAASTDGTVKYLFNGMNNQSVESVYIPDRDRATLCVSSQAGCRMGCVFCMTGRQGFHGNLSVTQIINQILSIDSSESLTNIVFMGMGEPLDNTDNLLNAIDILTSPWGMAWSPKRITVSSIGKMDTLKRLLDEKKVHVAISLHSPYPSEREQLMPVERAYHIRDVITLLKQYDFAHQRRLSFEYIVWKGVNDDMRHADALARTLKGLDCRVNLIRFHAIPDSELKPVSNDVMVRFRDRLNDAGITATIRASRGEDIQAACGMLAGQK